MAGKISLDDQIKAMEEAISNSRSYINLVQRYVAKGERPEEVLADARARLPRYEAILETLRWLSKNRETIIAVHKQKAP